MTFLALESGANHPLGNVPHLLAKLITPVKSNRTESSYVEITM
jgi:hypothetical protein